MVPQLLVEKPPSSTTLQKPFSSYSVRILKVGFIVDELPRPPTPGAPTFATLVLRKPPAQITSLANVEPAIRFGLDYINIIHTHCLQLLPSAPGNPSRGAQPLYATNQASSISKPSFFRGLIDREALRSFRQSEVSILGVLMNNLLKTKCSCDQ